MQSSYRITSYHWVTNDSNVTYILHASGSIFAFTTNMTQTSNICMSHILSHLNIGCDHVYMFRYSIGCVYVQVQHSTGCKDSLYSSLVLTLVTTIEALWFSSLDLLKHTFFERELDDQDHNWIAGVCLRLETYIKLPNSNVQVHHSTSGAKYCL